MQCLYPCACYGEAVIEYKRKKELWKISCPDCKCPPMYDKSKDAVLARWQAQYESKKNDPEFKFKKKKGAKKFTPYPWNKKHLECLLYMGECANGCTDNTSGENLPGEDDAGLMYLSPKLYDVLDELTCNVSNITRQLGWTDEQRSELLEDAWEILREVEKEEALLREKKHD